MRACAAERAGEKDAGVGMGLMRMRVGVAERFAGWAVALGEAWRGLLGEDVEGLSLVLLRAWVGFDDGEEILPLDGVVGCLESMVSQYWDKNALFC